MLVASSIVLVSCNKGDENENGNNTEVDVYVAGSEMNASNGYCKNGVGERTNGLVSAAVNNASLILVENNKHIKKGE
jgi:hypothetical protein